MKECAHLEGELGFALWLFEHDDGEHQADHQGDTEDRQRPGSQPSLNSYNTENTHQHTWWDRTADDCAGSVTVR